MWAKARAGEALRRFRNRVVRCGGRRGTLPGGDRSGEGCAWCDCNHIPPSFEAVMVKSACDHKKRQIAQPTAISD